MDIKPRKTVKSPKTSGSQKAIRNRAGENGHKAQKKQEKVQKHPKARGKYGTEPVRMDIKPRKAVKKSKILRKPERKTEKCR